MTRVASPSSLAVSIPPASVRLEITTAMRASPIFPEAIFRAMASKLEPRPERRIPKFFMAVQCTAVAPCGQLVPRYQGEEQQERKYDSSPGVGAHQFVGCRPGEHQDIEDRDQFFRPKQSSDSESKRELYKQRQNQVVHPALQRNI